MSDMKSKKLTVTLPIGYWMENLMALVDLAECRDSTGDPEDKDSATLLYEIVDLLKPQVEDTDEYRAIAAG